MLIGEMSRRTGVKVPTIRYYEGIGLLPAPARTDGGQRSYDGSHLRRLTFVRHARELGFEVEAIRQLLDLDAHPERPCDKADEIARHHLGEVERRIGKLVALRSELSRMVEACSHGTAGECRVIQVIADHDLCEADRH